MTKKIDIKQKIFNKVYKFLVKQGKKSNRANSCRYLNDDGSKCAIGCLIEHYDPQIEAGQPHGGSIKRIIKEGFDIQKMIPLLKDVVLDNSFIDFLTNLQYAHDDTVSNNFLPSLKIRFDLLAKKYNLVFKE